MWSSERFVETTTKQKKKVNQHKEKSAGIKLQNLKRVADYSGEYSPEVQWYLVVYDELCKNMHVDTDFFTSSNTCWDLCLAVLQLTKNQSIM